MLPVSISWDQNQQEEEEEDGDDEKEDVDRRQDTREGVDEIRTDETRRGEDSGERGGG